MEKLRILARFKIMTLIHKYYESKAINKLYNTIFGKLFFIF